MAASGKKIALTIKDQVYNIIKENILTERYKPGERVSEIVIAEELGVSRSPVRSAINELVGEGLLEAKPHHYVRVRKLTEQEIIDIYEMRLLVEQYAITKAVETLDENMRGHLKKFANDFRTCCNYEHLTKYVELDTRFHQYLIENTGNQLVIDTFARIGALISSFRIISLKSLERFNQSIVEHTDIIEGICDRDAVRAIEACRIHLTLAKNEIVLSLQNTSAQ